MTNFFLQAPQVTSFEGRVVDAIERNPLVSVMGPVGCSTDAWLARLAFQRTGTTIVIFPDGVSAMAKFRLFCQAGYVFPDVAVLDANQPPHQWRQTREAVVTGQVQILFATVDRMATMSMVELIAKAPSVCLVLLEAQNLFPVYGLPERYARFWEGWDALGEKPRLIVSMPVMTPQWLVQLSRKLSDSSVPEAAMKPFPIEQLVSYDSLQVEVHRLLGERAKFKRLVWLLMGRPAKGNLGQATSHGKVLIHCRSAKAMVELAGQLNEYGFRSVWMLHKDQPAAEQRQVMEAFHAHPHGIWLTHETLFHRFPPVGHGESRIVVYWHPASSVESFVTQLAMVPKGVDGLLKAWVLYTKEDFHLGINWIQNLYKGPAEIKAGRASGLIGWRRWILSESCRRQGLFKRFLGRDRQDRRFEAILSEPCGMCDRCQVGHSPGMMRHFLNRLLY